ncbi:MAG: GNAT family N-acetyltransferase [Pseudomonadota bacterium]
MPEAAPIRRATAADGPACAAVLVDWIRATPWMPQEMTQDQFAEILSDGLPKREAWVIGDPVVGYLSMDPAENHIWGFYVAQRGAGLGRQLMDQAKQGRTYLRLNTHLPNKRAHAFYAREGFVRVGDPWDGDDGVPEIRMEWQVTASGEATA